MNLNATQQRLELPESLHSQLLDFRRRVWQVKLIESTAGAVAGVLIAFLVLFVLDRLWETPQALRGAIFLATLTACAMVPLAVHRWVWKHRKLEQLARLLSRKHPAVGDHLLGIIELVRDESEQARSRTLCEAAIRQVAEEASKRDFRNAVPNPRHRRYGMIAAVLAVPVIVLFALYPAAATNAWTRLLLPWSNTARFTFARFAALPEHLVVAHGEPFTLTVQLLDETQSRPDSASARVGIQQPVNANRTGSTYEFQLPAQIEAGWLQLSVGDAGQRIYVDPTFRPELNSIVADVDLPDYLQRTQGQKKDVRGGTVAVVNGSRVTLTATANRELSAGQVDGQPAVPSGPVIGTHTLPVNGTRHVELTWHDTFGLSGKEPFRLSVNGRDDETPSLACEDLPRQKVVLDSEQLTFRVKAQDDYGIRHVGIEWKGMDGTTVQSPAGGERMLAAGGPDKDSLELTGTFAAESLGIEPQPIQVRLFAEDYFPGRERTYSAPYLFYVLNAEQHAVWLTEQLSKWHRQSLEVRDRELQLHETNRELRELSADELDQPDTRRRIEQQAFAERANGRRLTGLVTTGEDLVKQATRNPEFGVGHLEKWAEMLQILKDIAGNRMPSVADLLKQGSQAQTVAQAQAAEQSRMAGQVRASSSASSPSESKSKPKSVPAIADVESSQPTSQKPGDPPSPKDNTSAPRLGLPVTTLIGGKSNSNSCPAGQKVEEAVQQQQDLLAEFDKISDELNRVLANLEGSTLVKRLKAASRLQYRIGDRIADQVADAFGVSEATIKENPRNLLKDLAAQEAKSSQDVSTIMDDMQSYFERRRFVKFKTVLDEMREQDVIGSLRQLGDDIRKESGVSIAQCEFWSDTLDRWAEDLVDPTSGGT